MCNARAGVYLRVDGRRMTTIRSKDDSSSGYAREMNGHSTTWSKQYERRVFGLLLRLIGRRDEAEDLAQEVFVQVFKAIGGFEVKPSSRPGFSGSP